MPKLSANVFLSRTILSSQKNCIKRERLAHEWKEKKLCVFNLSSLAAMFRIRPHVNPKELFFCCCWYLSTPHWIQSTISRKKFKKCENEIVSRLDNPFDSLAFSEFTVVSCVHGGMDTAVLAVLQGGFCGANKWLTAEGNVQLLQQSPKSFPEFQWNRCSFVSNLHCHSPINEKLFPPLLRELLTHRTRTVKICLFGSVLSAK